MNVAMALKDKDLDTYEKRAKYSISVIGCGRMGLSTACLFAEAGFKVICIDENQHIISLLKRGRSPFVEPGLKTLLKKHLKEGRIIFTGNIQEAASASDVIVLVVQTPVDEKQRPDYSYVERACKEVGMGLRRETLIILESTVGPGVTETLVKESLEFSSGFKAGMDFGLAYSPIRASPGRVLRDIAGYPRVVGAINEPSLKVASLIMSKIVDAEVVEVKNMKTAESVKLFENVYRDVNIALTNELALFCEKAGIDFLEAQKGANTQPYCHILIPGLVGGHIPTDPYLLIEEAESVNAELRLVKLSRRINDEMLDHAIYLLRKVLRSCRKTIRRAKISVFGVSYRPNVKEARGSLTSKVVNRLISKGATVNVYDPFFTHRELIELNYPVERTMTKTVEGADCLLILVGHDKFRRLNLRRIRVLANKPVGIVDMSNVIDPVKAKKEGFICRVLGEGY